MSDAPILEVDGLSTVFFTRNGLVRAVDDLSFSVGRGETLAIVGESGCGKSISALSIMRLVPQPPGRIVAGTVKLEGRDLLAMSEADMRDVRGNAVSMIFQEPMTSLNPVLSIGRQIGLRNADQHITGAELETLSDEQLAVRIRDVNIFARMVPAQKLRIVKALKLNNEVVAMTGDGVNDAPALKAAHIGVAMGERGTDVAREAASLVLLDDDFNSIVAAVRMGRRIYDNLKKAMMFILSVHIPIAGLSLIPVLMNWPLILSPVHIVFLELIIDPSCTLIFEADKEERDVMKRKPRSINEKLFDGRTLLNCFFQGSLTLVVTVAIYLFVRHDHSDEAARALAFFTLVVCNLGIILSSRSLSRSGFSMLRAKNAAFKWVVTGTLTVLGLIFTVPFLTKLFRFGAVTWDDFLLALAGAFMAVALMELLKMYSLNRKTGQPE